MKIVKLHCMKDTSLFSPTLPALFVSHGAPTAALHPGAAETAVASYVQALPRPKAVLIVSAHWDTAVPTLSVACRPETIHDFHGFPQALYDIRYSVPGAVPWAMEARALLEEAGFEVALDAKRGLDHGAWVPLRAMYPQADVPVLAMSLQSRLGPTHQYRLGRALAPLRAAGVLIVGSGNLTHNLRHLMMPRGGGEAPSYAVAFQDWIYRHLQAKAVDELLAYRSRAPGAVEAHPTDEHLLPLFLALGTAGADYAVERLHDGIEYNILAMDAYAFHAARSIDTEAA